MKSNLQLGSQSVPKIFRNIVLCPSEKVKVQHLKETTNQFNLMETHDRRKLNKNINAKNIASGFRE